MTEDTDAAGRSALHARVLTDDGDQPFGDVDLAGLQRQTLNAAKWVAVNRWVSRGSSLVVFALLGRFLEPRDIGLAALATVFMTLFALLSDQGFSDALVQRRALTKSHSDTAFAISMGTSLLLAGLTIALAKPISAGLHAPRLAPILMVSSIVLPLGALSSVPAAILERDFKFKILTQREVFANLAGGGTGVACAALGAGVWSLVAQVIVAAFVGFLVLWTTSDWRPGLDIHRQSARDLQAVGVGLLGVQLFGFVDGQSDKLLIGAFVDPAAVGYYYIGSKIISTVIDIQTSVIQTISLTTLSKVQHDPAAFRKIFYKFISTSGAIATFSFAALAALAPIFVPLVFGNQWRSSVPITQILCLIGALNSVLVFDREALVAMGRSRLALSISAVQTAVGVVAVLATVAFGPIGVAIGVTARQYIVWPFRLRQLSAALHLDVKNYLRRVLAPLLAGLVTAAVMYGLVRVLPAAHGFGSDVGVSAVALSVGFAAYLSLGYVLFREVLQDVRAEVSRFRAPPSSTSPVRRRSRRRMDRRRDAAGQPGEHRHRHRRPSGR